MRHFDTLAVLALLLLPGTARAQESGAGIAGGKVSVAVGEGGNVSIPYRLVEPERVEDGVHYPLIVFLHGAGERGTDNEKQLVHFVADMATPEKRAAYPCFVLAPQCPEDRRWVEVEWSLRDSTPQGPPSPAMRGAIAALAHVLATKPIDREAIVVTGLSMGGYGCFDLVSRYPEWFAAAAPICGGGDERRAAAFAGLPIHVWHGDADKSVPVERSRSMVEALKALGGKPDYHELAGVGHDAWNTAYADTNFMQALIGARRSDGFDGAPALAALCTVCAGREGERIGFLGDSITWAGNEAGGYVDRIRSALAADERTRAVTILPAGISGNRVPDLLARLDADLLDEKPTLVWIYIGINDVWHSQQGRGTPADEYESGLTTLIERCAKAGAKVVLATPSVIGEKTDGSNPLDAMLEQYAAISRKVAAATGAGLCDLRVAMLEHLRVFNSTNAQSGVLTRDGVHLNADGNRFLAQHCALALVEALRAR